MRIISGEHRGRKLLAPDGDQTRPVTDRAKQSIFDVLAHRLPDARVYDCFAGTGSFGLESLSRGSVHATFFEQHKPTLALLRRNIDAMKLADRSTVITDDCLCYLARSTPTHRADVIFLDPPYRFLREKPAELQAAAEAIARSHLAPGGVVVFRHDAADTLALPGLSPIDARNYGGMAVEFLALAS